MKAKLFSVGQSVHTVVLRMALLGAGLAFCGVLPVSGAPLSEREALGRMTVWMREHPVMGVAAGRTVRSVEWFPSAEAAYHVYVVCLSPRGYAVLNSDDRLPLAVAFSAVSGVSLDDLPDNSFRALLLAQSERTGLKLADMGAAGEPDLTYLRSGQPGLLSFEQYGPYLETVWDQCNPYNLYCPEDPDPWLGYGNSVPTGCTPTAFAQVLYYHLWPLYGHGSHAYTDSDGSVTGAHNAVFSTPFDWGAMQTEYDWWEEEQEGDTAVADLMCRLGVAAEADYESGGTSSSVQTLGERINQYLYFEQPVYSGSQTLLLPRLDADLKNGYPAVVAIPGHAIVADGWMNDNGTITYHINYGWGGDNNGWFSANDVTGSPLSYGCTSIRPMLLALPVERSAAAVDDEPAQLNWLLPVKREGEASSLMIQRLEQQGGTWSSSAESLEHTTSSGWSLVSGGHSGNCWFTGPNGYTCLTLNDEFVPVSGTSLTFWMKYRLGTATFSVSISTNGGETFTTLSQWHDQYQNSFQSYNVSLSAYAGKRVSLRFELSSGSYYTDGGVWLDDLSMSSGTWHRWTDFAEDTVLATQAGEYQPTHLTDLGILEAGSYTLAAVVIDTNDTRHALGPVLTLTVRPRYTYREEGDGSVTITGYVVAGDRFVLPSELDGMTVSGIATGAISSAGLVSVLMPASVTNIEAGAFAGSDALERAFFAGDAPTAPGTLFDGMSLTVYYMPGTDGWGGTFGGRPAVLWNPAVQSGATFGFGPGGFGFKVAGTAGIPVMIEAVGNLCTGVWDTVVETALDGSGFLNFTDPDASGMPARFYRINFP